MADTLSVQVAPPAEPDHSQHDQEMIKKAEGASPQQEPASDGKKYADRFNTVEDLEKSYKELQREYTKLKETKPADTPNVPPADGNTPAPDGNSPPRQELKIDEGEARQELENKGLDFDAFAQEFQQSGALSEESFKKLENAGIPKAFVDSYIEGQRVIAQQATNAVHAAVGGEETYNAMLQWAKTNLPKEAKVAFNRAVEGSLQDTLLAVKGLHADYVKAVGSEGTTIFGDSGGDISGSAFRSWAEVTNAMNDPRYGKDPAYRADVERRLSISRL